MSSNHGRAKRFESAVSTCLLVILFLIGVGVFIKQFKYDSSQFGIDAAVGQLSSQKSETGKMDLRSFVPPGFNLLSNTEIYVAENLYEKINGKAPLYTESGFEKLLTQRFVNKDDENLWMELSVYDMAAVRNAFSVYSVQRRAEADILSLFHTSFGYRTSNALYFVHGKYYIELVGSAELAGLFKAITATARKIQENLIVDDDIRIAELKLFPSEGIVQGSIKLYLADAFGFEELTNTFTGRYKIDDEIITLFFSKRPNEQAAKKLADSYYEFLIDNGAKDKRKLGWGNGNIVSFYGSIELIFNNGAYMAGIHEAESIEHAVKVAKMLNDNLSKASKE